MRELHGGNARVAGEWLATFQRSESAWKVCANALQGGPAQENLDYQFFAAQTLARASRAFTARVPEASWAERRDELARLLHGHGRGPGVVWRQLALALTGADLWLGTWTASGILESLSLPLACRRELLALPPELLFCERALPLDDAKRWQQAAQAMANECAPAFAFLLSEVDEAAGLAGVQSALEALAAWLRALRKSNEWVPGAGGEFPLQTLAGFEPRLLALARFAPVQAADVARQLAMWTFCDAEVHACLQPLLTELLPVLVKNQEHGALLPLLSDLAVDRWPRATIGLLPLDWQSVTWAALELLEIAVCRTMQEDLAGCEAEDVFGVWQVLARTLRTGTWEWQPSPEQLCASTALTRSFELFCSRAVGALMLKDEPCSAVIERLMRTRGAAERALAAWAEIFGSSDTWEAAMWQPLRTVASKPSAVTPELCRNTEVAMWWAATLAASSHELRPPCVGSAILELSILDAAPQPWRALLWATACCLAGTAQGDVCRQLLPWCLQRPPCVSHADAPWLLHNFELAYARQLEVLCRQLPEGSQLEHAERLARLALEPIPTGALHDDSARARGTLLLACRHLLGGDAARVCNCLSQAVLAPLRHEVELEAATHGTGGRWPAMQILCAALNATLPEKARADNAATQAATSIWEANWDLMQAALLAWSPSPVTSQPAEAASDALASAAVSLEPLLRPALQLLTESASRGAEPHAQINAMCRVVNELPGPTMQQPRVAELLAEAIIRFSRALLGRPGVLQQSPPTLEALYRLLAIAIHIAPLASRTANHAVGGYLRPRLLGYEGLVKRCLEVAADALPECPAPGGVQEMLKFVSRLLKGLKAGREAEANLQALLRSSLPQVCTALTRALASQPQLTKIESVNYAAEVLIQVAEVFPNDAEAALSDGLATLVGMGVPEYSRHRLARHVLQRPQWASLGAWIDGLQQIAFDWQNERRQSIT